MWAAATQYGTTFVTFDGECLLLDLKADLSILLLMEGFLF
jgi:hypothetical protein